MKKIMTKILFYLVPVIIIGLLALIMADAYYRQPFYTGYFLISLGVMLFLWIALSLIFHATYAYPSLKGIYWRAAVAWTTTAVLGWAINHLVLSGFFASQGAKPGWSVFGLMFVWIVGLLSILIWYFGLSLLQRIFLMDQLRVLKIIIVVLFGILVVVIAAILVINGGQDSLTGCRLFFS